MLCYCCKTLLLLYRRIRYNCCETSQQYYNITVLFLQNFATSLDYNIFATLYYCCNISPLKYRLQKYTSLRKLLWKISTLEPNPSLSILTRKSVLCGTFYNIYVCYCTSRVICLLSSLTFVTFSRSFTSHS